MIKRIIIMILIGVITGLFVVFDNHEGFDFMLEIIYMMTLITENIVSASTSIARSLKENKKGDNHG